MGKRVLTVAYLVDLVARLGGPFPSGAAAARAVGAEASIVPLPEPLRALADERRVYATAEAHVPLGVAQALLLREAVGHADDDVEVLATVLVGGTQPGEQDFDAIPLDIDSLKN